MRPEEFTDDPGFVIAYMLLKRRQPQRARYVVSAVVDQDGGRIAYGDPCDWENGIASGVMSGVYSVTELVVEEHVVAPIRSQMRLSDPKRPFVYGVACDKGMPQSMEDRHRVQKDFITAQAMLTVEKERAYRVGTAHLFAVLDGHCGSEAAAFCADRLPTILAQCILHDTVDNRFTNAIRDAFIATDDALLAHLREKGPVTESGAVAVVALLHPMEHTLYIANVGDCRAVLCRSGKAVDLSIDHRPQLLSECQRVEQDGGFIKYGRLNGYLGVTRAFGGLDTLSDFPIPHKAAGLSADPAVHKYFIGEEDEFVILASDGLWDVLDSQTAVTLARKALYRADDPQLASEMLVDEALRRESEDNVTVMIVGLNEEQSGRRGSIVRSKSQVENQWEPQHGVQSSQRPRFAFGAIQSLSQALHAIDELV